MRETRALGLSGFNTGCALEGQSQATHTSTGPRLKWRCPALTDDLTHIGDSCPRACFLCQVFSQLPNHTVYFLVLWPNSFSSKNHWQNTVTSCSLELYYPLVAVSSSILFCSSCFHLSGCYTLGFLSGVMSLRNRLCSCANGHMHVCPHTWIAKNINIPFIATQTPWAPAPARTQKERGFPGDTSLPGKCLGAAQLLASVWAHRSSKYDLAVRAGWQFVNTHSWPKLLCRYERTKQTSDV